MRPVFNKNTPYGEVSGVLAGMPRVKYCQNGYYFDAQGVWVPSPEQQKLADLIAKAEAEESHDEPKTEEPVVVVPDAPAQPEPAAETAPLLQPFSQPVPPSVVKDEGSEPPTVDYQTMHHVKLKALVKERGGQYTDRATAIAFLTGQ